MTSMDRAHVESERKAHLYSTIVESLNPDADKETILTLIIAHMEHERRNGMDDAISFCEEVLAGMQKDYTPREKTISELLITGLKKLNANNREVASSIQYGLNGESGAHQ